MLLSGVEYLLAERGENMANIKSAKKRIKVIKRKTLENQMRKSQLKTMVRKFEEYIANGELDTAREQLPDIQKKLYQTAAHGVIHKKNASRKLSRLSARLNSAAIN